MARHKKRERRDRSKAEDSLLEVLWRLHRLSTEEARKVLAVFKKAGIVALNADSGHYHLKHKGFLSRDVIDLALAIRFPKA